MKKKYKEKREREKKSLTKGVGVLFFILFIL